MKKKQLSVRLSEKQYSNFNTITRRLKHTHQSVLSDFIDSYNEEYSFALRKDFKPFKRLLRGKEIELAAH